MPKQPLAKPATMVDRIAKALAKADDKVVVPDPARYRRLALAALKTMTTNRDHDRCRPRGRLVR